MEENMHPNNTQTKESLNNAVGRLCLKFKQFGTTLTLTTRVNIVVSILNTGFKAFYNKLFQELGIQQSCNKCLSNRIVRLDKLKRNNAIRKTTIDYIPQYKHDIQPKKREQNLEERTSTKVGTYGSRIAMVKSDDNQSLEETKLD